MLTRTNKRMGGPRRVGVMAVATALHALPRPRDPGRAGLRRATRAALVIPALFALATVAIGAVQVTTFVAFGGFALLVLGDFGGARLPRAEAYGGAVLIGAVLVLLGTGASFNPWVAALAMFVVGFCIQFAGVFGGYAAAAQTALLLAFVLAVSVPASLAAVGPRLLGWCLAGAVSTVAAVALWPRMERLTLRREAAAACSALAAVIAAQRERPRPAPADLAQLRQTATTAVATVRRSFAATSKRPAGPARRDRAFVELLTELDRTRVFVTGPLKHQLAAHHPCLAAGNALAGAVVRALEASAAVLTGGPPPDLEDLQRARRAHRAALDSWAAAALQAGTPPQAVLDDLEADEALRVVSYLALALGSNAVLAVGGRPSTAVHLPAEAPRGDGVSGALARIARTVRTYLAPRSSVLHTSLRVGLGLALAVLLSQVLRLDHAFWVVLGTLSVLRANALATGRTVLQALAGTVAGVIVGALFMATVGAHAPALWAALPVGIFLAAYAASAIGFLAGQAAFTVVVIILFNLIAPGGWQIGLVRIEDVAIGAGISVLAGVLLWPRGARGEARRAVAALYRAVAVLLAAAFAQALEGEQRADMPGARTRAVQAFDRAGDAFDRFLRERGAQPLDPQTAAALVAAGAHTIMAADLLAADAAKGYRAEGLGAEGSALRAQAQALVATFGDLAGQLDRASADVPPQRVSEVALREAEVDTLRHWQENPGDGRAAIAAVAVAEWIRLLGRLIVTVEQPAAAVVEAARVPWWR